MIKPQIYEKVFSRDFSLALIQIWCRGEAFNPKQWTKKKQPYQPYILFERKDGTVNCYYNKKGVEWIKKEIIKTALKDKSFLTKLEKKILDSIKILKPIYKKQKALELNYLKEFLREKELIFPWLEAMWWICEMKSKELKNINIKRINKLRELTNDLSAGSDMVVRKSLQKIYPKINNFVGVLSLNEIYSGKLPNLNTLKKRNENYYFTNNKLYVGKTQTCIEKEFNIKLQKINFDKTLKEIKGVTAQKGNVVGRVRKIMGHEQMDKIKKGEILVSPMTMPDFLSAMKKASAIITDEGGLACHAAIIARELRKPCIVGTKIATQVLKDGDYIEVDADNGVVKIIKRK